MRARDFCYWLQGLFELGNPVTLDEHQTDLIKRHLALVFIHEIDPSMSDDPEVQQQLQDIHDGVEELKQRKPKPGPQGPRGKMGRSRGDTKYTC